MALDERRKFIKSWWYAGVVQGQDKWKYEITGDSLTFREGVSYCPSQRNAGKTGKLKFYTWVNKRRVTTKTYRGDAGKLLAAFSKALWDASGEP